LAYADLGEVHRGIEFCEQALVIAHEVGIQDDIAKFSWDLGKLLERQGNLEQAVKLMQVCVDYRHQIGCFCQYKRGPFDRLNGGHFVRVPLILIVETGAT
jgi:hypothetical protein